MRQGSEKMFPIVSEYLDGDECVESVCERYGLSKSQFYYWHRKYKSTLHQDAGEAIGFVPVDMVSVSGGYRYEIETPSGMIFRSHQLLPVSYVLELRRSGC